MKCPKCGMEFNRKDNLKRHLLNVHEVKPSTIGKYLPTSNRVKNTSKKISINNLLSEFVGKDKQGGKTIRLNRTRLEVNGKGYAELLFLGDIHYGHPGCDVERVQRMIDYCLKKHIYVLGMGDYIEAGLRNSVGDSVYMQNLNPQDQMDFITEQFQPLADANLLIGIHIGNHEGRILKDTSVNVASLIARMLRVPYLGYACWSLIYVGNQSYTVYSLHGSSGSRYVYTKLKALVDIAHNFDADILAMGHVHELANEAILVQQADKTRKMIIERKKFLLLTGHFLRYDDSYAQEKGYPMGKLGSPKVKLFSTKHDIHISA